jgi:peroxiredoxin
LDEEQKQTTRILAVSVDGKENLQKMIDRISMEDGIIPDYTLLTDVDHRVIDRYGIYNPAERRGRPVPHPMTLVIDKEGVVRWAMVEVNYRIRPTNEDVLAALGDLR